MTIENRTQIDWALAEDRFGNTIPVPNTFECHDETAPNKVLSPFTYLANTPFVLQPGKRAQELVISYASSDLRISKFSDFSEHWILPTWMAWTIGCGQHEPIYIDSWVGGTVSFYFNIV